MGLKPSINETCLYWAKREDNAMFVLVYVDDILIASRDMDWIMEIKEGLLQDFDIKDLGPTKYCLGLEINQKEDEIQLSQEGYIRGLLKTYGMEECNSVVTPSELCANNIEVKEAPSNRKKWPYRELIGALMYISVATRPDIANAVSRLAQYANEPQRSHWLAAKRVLRYLAGLADLRLIYSQTNKPLVGFADADWGGCTKDRRSYTGYVYLLSGAPITWKSQKQRTVALSSTEAKYVSLSEATKEAVYLHSLLHEFDLSELAAITFCNGAARKLHRYGYGPFIVRSPPRAHRAPINFLSKQRRLTAENPPHPTVPKFRFVGDSPPKPPMLADSKPFGCQPGIKEARLYVCSPDSVR
ncbi:uncharacterized protein [Linepithema humile]|uniref:uncharacterized protein n=1 Tax=Linepithema humile TaxID=83485 RepID=UPI00351DE815